MKLSINLLNLICKTTGSEPVTVNENTLSERQVQTPVSPPPSISPKSSVETKVKYFPGDESTVIAPSFINEKVSSVCASTT